MSGILKNDKYNTYMNYKKKYFNLNKIIGGDKKVYHLEEKEEKEEKEVHDMWTLSDNIGDEKYHKLQTKTKVLEGWSSTNDTFKHIGEPKNFLVVTHNGRIRCWLEKFMPEGFKEEYKKISEDKTRKTSMPRFKNCAILKVVISNGNLTISLLYEGQVTNKKKGAYWSVTDKLYEGQVTNKKKGAYCSVTDKLYEGQVTNKKKGAYCSVTDHSNNKNKSDVKFVTYESVAGVDVDKLLQELGIPSIRFPITLFIVRHGEGFHNISKDWFKGKDPSLTPFGIEQAITAGKILANVVGNIMIHAVFVSLLRRTWETAFWLLLGFDSIGQRDHSNIPFNIIPCLHEVRYDKSGNCDSGFLHWITSIFANENKSSCINSQDNRCKLLNNDNIFANENKSSCINSQDTRYKLLNNDTRCKLLNNHNINHEIIWPKKFPQCNNTNLIVVILRFILTNQ